MEIAAIILLIGALYVADHIRKFGTLTVGPGCGTVKVITGWCPRKAKIWLCKQPPIPGCSQLKDKAKVHKLVEDGFIIKYHIESGPRTIKWVAWKAWNQKKCKKNKAHTLYL